MTILRCCGITRAQQIGRKNIVGSRVFFYMLSKSKFIGGWQCEKRAYLTANDPKLATPPDAATRARFAAGTRFGELARTSWPNGILISSPAFRHDDAVNKTKKLLKDPNIEVIFEAGFTALDTRVRADVMIRKSGCDTWDLVEVKSSTSPKLVHDMDLAIQRVVLEASGVNIESTKLMLIDTTYVRSNGGLDLAELFKIIDRTAEVSILMPDISPLVDRLHEVVDSGTEPTVPIGPHCAEPYGCDFFAYCTSDRPENWVMYVPGFGLSRVQKLEATGVVATDQISSDEHLNELQKRAIESSKSGDIWISEDISTTIANIAFPLRFIDFEAASPVVPLYASTRPYERIPFQWSCHTLHDDGRLEHAEYLAEGDDDPRVEFTETLLSEIEGPGSVLVYSPYEATTLKMIGERFEDLQTLVDPVFSRFVDLMGLVKSNYYHRDLKGSFSIKDVLPVMVPGFDYSDLAIQEGETAASRFVDLVEGRVEAGDTGQLRSNLLAYCERDTEAMVKIWQHLELLAQKIQA